MAEEKTINCEMFEKFVGLGSVNRNIKDLILENYGSFANLEKQARQQGEWEAKSYLSGAYKDGIPELNVEKDIDKAIGWYQASMDVTGDPLPTELVTLGTLYDGKGTVSSQRKAHQLYHEAAQLGSVRAELNLAESYRCGVEGVIDEDLEEAFKWYRRAVDEEPVDVESLSQMALMARGTLRKLEMDVKLHALSSLHQYYLSGDCPEGKPQQLKAVYYLKKAAELGHVDSQFELGLTYLQGLSDVPKNLQEAKRWLGKAADKGNHKAKEILEKFTQQDAIEPKLKQTNKDEEACKNVFQQHLDIFKEQIERSKNHPFAIENPMIYNESMFTRFPDSPTAKRYLIAYQKARDGLHMLKEGNFKEAATLMAHSYLYENTMLNSFPEMKIMRNRINVICMIFEELKVNSKFFEGLLLLINFYQTPAKNPRSNFGSFKTDMKKTMFLKNFIHLIENDDREVNPNGNFEDNYKAWLHVLYFFLGSHYTIAGEYDEGAQAFEMSLQLGKLANPQPLNHCPVYFGALAGFGYCLSSICSELRTKGHKVSNFTKQEQDDQIFETYYNKHQRIPENSFYRWNVADLGNKVKEVFMEYFKEAPECDDKYPNCHYHLAIHYLLNEKNVKKAREWKAKGEDAEEKRLPFKENGKVGSKDILTLLDMLPIPDRKMCDYEECPNMAGEQLKLRDCPCKIVSYCGSDCQRKDWKEHKKSCTLKKSKKDK